MFGVIDARCTNEVQVSITSLLVKIKRNFQPGLELFKYKI